MIRVVKRNINVSIIGNVLLILLLASCSSRHVPAPVVDVKAHTPLNKRIKVLKEQNILSKKEKLCIQLRGVQILISVRLRK
jgi:hypothetical protein